MKFLEITKNVLSRLLIWQLPLTVSEFTMLKGHTSDTCVTQITIL